MKRAFSAKNLWERSPHFVKQTAGRLVGLAPLPVVLGRSFRATRRFIHEAQWWPAERTTEYQVQMLQKVVRLAYDKSAFYRRIMNEIGFEPGDLKTLDDMRRLPLIDKNTLRENLNDMTTCDTANAGVDYTSTGGSSGAPLEFYIGRERSAIEYAYLTASWERIGYSLKSPLAVFRGRVVASDRRGLRHEWDPIFNHHYYSTFYMNDESMIRYLEHVGRLGPCMLHVYPSAVAKLAAFIQARGLEPPRNVRGVVAESENVYPEQRELVERVLDCRYFSCYGHTEKLVAAAECEHTSDYHIWPTYGYFELLDEDGAAVTTPGQLGEIVGTGFINTVTPFIRYRTGDFAEYVGERCAECGREHPVIRGLRGHRTQEVLITSDGDEISWTSLNMHDDTFSNVRQFQFVQVQPGRAALRVVPMNGFNDADRQKIRQNLDAKLNGRISIDVTAVDSISLTKRGKAVYVDQRIDGL